MKLGVAGVFSAAALIGCCSAPTCRTTEPGPSPVDADLPDEASRQRACKAAGDRLDALKCKEARADFAAFCAYEMAHDVPLRPLCLAKITDCSQVNQCK